MAEAPPSAADRFFYFDNVASHDWLFLALMRWLYQEARDLEVDEIRTRKRMFLERFARDGYFLIDAIDEPLPRGVTSAERRRLIAQGLPALKRKVQSVVSPDTRLVLISNSVYRECCGPLRIAGFNVLNTEALDFPSMGHQRDFARKLGQLLDEGLRETIRELQEALRLWSPGEANQKAREQYVAKTFLRCLGIEFSIGELEQPPNDPPDVVFRGARFEIKEIQEAGRRRGDEYKRKLARALKAERLCDLLDSYRPEPLPIGEVCSRIVAETRGLAQRRYSDPALRRSLDLLFYVNLSATAEKIIVEGPVENLDAVRREGWRSVSFLFAGSAAGVLVAESGSPVFLSEAFGRLSYARSGS